MSYLLKPGTDFTVVLDGDPAAAAEATVRNWYWPWRHRRSSNPLRSPNPMSADTFFLQALSEAQRTNVAVADSGALFSPQELSSMPDPDPEGRISAGWKPAFACDKRVAFVRSPCAKNVRRSGSSDRCRA